LDFFTHVDFILRTMAQARVTKQLSTTTIKMLLNIYSYWTEHNLLPQDALADNKFTLLDHADTFLARA
jgi:hypothetical protein